jgi:hypothetical protein
MLLPTSTARLRCRSLMNSGPTSRSFCVRGSFAQHCWLAGRDLVARLGLQGREELGRILKG